LQEIAVYDLDGNTLTNLVQYDTDVYVNIKDSRITDAYRVQFFNSTSESALVMDSTYNNGILSVKIPNDLLEQPYTITGYVNIKKNGESKCLYAFRIAVRKKPVPHNWVHVDSKDYVTFEEIVAECRDFADNASASATKAKTSEINAKTSEINAVASASTASQKAADAATSASNAKASETNAKTSESNAKSSETKAKTSETNAKTSETASKTSETNAATSATTASQKATAAANSQSAAATSATNAKTSEMNAKTSETNSKTSETNAKTSETNAKTSEMNAATSASTAAQKATEASNSATTAQDYAVGSTNSAKHYYEQAKSISESFAGALRPMGTVTFANLPSLSIAAEGDMYNISDQFTTNANFKEGSGFIIPAGSNVYKTADGKWDVLAGTPVTSVNGQRGNVSITPANIGAAPENQNYIKSLSPDDIGITNTTTLEELPRLILARPEPNFRTVKWLNQHVQIQQDILAALGEDNKYGNLYIERGTSNTIKFRWELYNDNVTYVSTYDYVNNIGWRPWVKETAGRADYLNTNTINKNTNLNNIITPGVYQCAASATAATLTNCPTKIAFCMIVGRHAGTYQEIIEYIPDSPKRYMRCSYDYENKWGPWYRVYTSADPQPTVGYATRADHIGIDSGRNSLYIRAYTGTPPANATGGTFCQQVFGSGNNNTYVNVGIDGLGATGVNKARNAVYDNDGNQINLTYLKKSGDTMTGALNFANGTMNVVGDDASFGDHNVAGGIGIQGKNGNTRLDFLKKGDAANYKSITYDGTTLRMDGNCAYATSAGNSDTVDGHHFLWSSQSGTPRWVWGNGGDSTNQYIYDPSNFKVAYATSAGSATSAIKATQDGNGRNIVSTYFPKSGGSLNGALGMTHNINIKNASGVGNGITFTHEGDEMMSVKPPEGGSGYIDIGNGMIYADTIDPGYMCYVARGDYYYGHSFYSYKGTVKQGSVIMEGGTMLADKYNSKGGDYAEYWEYADSNPDGEDRAGLFVTFTGNKIRVAQKGDNPAKVGVVSATPSFVGDSDQKEWVHKYQKDIYGREIWQDVTLKDGTVVKDRVLNPDYDGTQKYVRRADRPEWDAVGTHGKLVVRDDGTCIEDSFCIPADGGIATKSNDGSGFYVMERLDENHIRIYMR